MGIDAEHYAAIISELDVEIAGLQQTRDLLARKMAALGMTPPDADAGPRVSPALSGTQPQHKEIRSDTFFGMTGAQAIRKYFEMTKRPASPKQIAEALTAGGFTTKSDNVYNTVFTALSRNKDTLFSNLGRAKGWGLKAWYSNAKGSEG